MKTKRILLLIFLVLVFLAGVGWLLLNDIRVRALPDYGKDLQLNGLDNQVEVLRDSLGIPHVYASSEKDLYMAVGYLQAQDRLWQMDLLRRVTTGRLSEIFGEDLINADLLFRSLKMTEKSRGILEEAGPDILSALEAFSSGVNQYIESNRKRLPPEFTLLGYKPEPWLPEHSINLIGYMAWDLSTGWTNETLLEQIRQQVGNDLYDDLIPDLLRQRTYVQPGYGEAPDLNVLAALAETVKAIDDLGLDVFMGSNNWAVAGSRSETGMPLLANDMHLGLMIPGIWYQMHQVVPGVINVTGVVLPGQPLVVAGHNDRIAWGFTNVMTDDADFYIETVNPEDSSEYRLDGAWHKFGVREETIRIGKKDSVVKSIAYTHRGPVISGFKGISGQVISMRWNGMEPSNELLGVFLLNRAQNWGEFRNALTHFIAVNQNVVYADVDGNIGLQSTIGLPIREGIGTALFPGDTSAYDWKGLVPFEELPFTYNPECGYVISANNQTVGPDYPHYISSWFDLPYRADRIREMILEKEVLSISDFAAIQADQTSKMAEKFLPVYLVQLRQTDMTPTGRLAFELLSGWNYDFDSGRPEPTIFEQFYYQLVEELALDQMQEKLFNDFIRERTLVKNFAENILGNPSSGWCDDVNTPGVTESFGDMVNRAFGKAVSSLEVKLGADPAAWEWGRVHTLTLKHPMAQVKLIDKLFGFHSGPWPVGGSFHTVGPYSFPLGNPSGVDHGASNRHLHSTADWDRSLTVIPTGVSGVPASEFYCNQTRMYVENRYNPDAFSREAVESKARFRMVFK
ncbi:MAG: penicillin acylase family protein [Bacteroidales bacterium]